MRCYSVYNAMMRMLHASGQACSDERSAHVLSEVYKYLESACDCQNVKSTL